MSDQGWRKQIELTAFPHPEHSVPYLLEKLGREPNELEAAMFGTTWCEHSGYVHSKPLLTVFDEVNAILGGGSE